MFKHPPKMRHYQINPHTSAPIFFHFRLNVNNAFSNADASKRFFFDSFYKLRSKMEQPNFFIYFQEVPDLLSSFFFFFLAAFVVLL